ncbi:MAG: Ig-like domain-containing protein, partial [Oscillospiraceae bacterium]|nr:Ig-like domain-containing protein [Oscillospiraceae bacterium]
MKRLLATIITLAMVLSLVPAAFAADLEAKTYTLDNSVIGGQSAKLSTVTDYGTRGWMFFGYDGDVTESSTSGNKQVGYVAGSTYGLMFNNKDAGSGAVTFALSLEAPSESGFYIPSTTWQPYSSKDAALNMYVGKESTDLTTVAQYTTSQNSVMSATGTDGNSKQTDYASKAVYTTSADKLVVAYETESQNYRFYNITLNPINNAKLEITADKAVDGKIAFSTTDTDKNAVITSTKVSGTDVDPMDIGNGFVEYKSDNTAVATVDANGTIIAGNTAGTAKIYAQSTDGKVKSNEITVTVSEPQPEEKTYTLDNTVIGGSSAKLSTVTDYGTRGWMFFGYDGDVTESNASGNKQVGYVASSANGLMFNNSNAGTGAVTFALLLETPAGRGFYIPSTNWTPVDTGAKFDMFVGKKSATSSSVSDYVVEKNKGMSATGKTGYTAQTDSAKAIYTTSADELVVAYKTENSNYRFHNISLTPIMVPELTITADKAELDTADNKTATISATVKETGSETSVAVANNFITYHSDNT